MAQKLREGGSKTPCRWLSRSGICKGKGSGLVLILILIVALIVAFLFMKQSGSLGIVKPPEQNPAPVQQAQDAVNQINEQQEKALEVLEGFE